MLILGSPPQLEEEYGGNFNSRLNLRGEAWNLDSRSLDRQNGKSLRVSANIFPSLEPLRCTVRAYNHNDSQRECYFERRQLVNSTIKQLFHFKTIPDFV